MSYANHLTALTGRTNYGPKPEDVPPSPAPLRKPHHLVWDERLTEADKAQVAKLNASLDRLDARRDQTRRALRSLQDRVETCRLPAWPSASNGCLDGRNGGRLE